MKKKETENRRISNKELRMSKCGGRERNPPRPSCFAKASQDKSGTPPVEGTLEEGRRTSRRRGSIHFRIPSLGGVRPDSPEVGTGGGLKKKKTENRRISNKELRMSKCGGPETRNNT